jgi:hypothetical protein
MKQNYQNRKIRYSFRITTDKIEQCTTTEKEKFPAVTVLQSEDSVLNISENALHLSTKYLGEKDRKLRGTTSTYIPIMSFQDESEVNTFG